MINSMIPWKKRLHSPALHNTQNTLFSLPKTNTEIPANVRLCQRASTCCISITQLIVTECLKLVIIDFNQQQQLIIFLLTKWSIQMSTLCALSAIKPKRKGKWKWMNRYGYGSHWNSIYPDFFYVSHSNGFFPFNFIEFWFLSIYCPSIKYFVCFVV